jgi:hypothetical protein
MKLRILVPLFVLACAGCATNADSVCQDISYCTTQSSEQEHACEAQAKQLAREAAASGCSSQYNAYFACAADKYQCNGNVVSFPGCESARTALDSCLNAQRASNACGELASRLDQCPDAPLIDPAPSDPSATTPAPCGGAEVCSSRCYLDNVTNVCRPQPNELARAVQCAQQCPL